MANVSHLGPVYGSSMQPNPQANPQGYLPVAKALTMNKTAMKRKAIAAGMKTSVKKAKKYGAGAKAILQNMKTTRPLNCWIAYRSYYSRLFVDLQQKDISAILHVLWERDPFHNKWTILAKAFSVIRDEKGKKDASLELFLVVSAPFVEIVGLQDYLPTLGFEIIVDDENQASLRQDPTFDIGSIPKSMINTIRSVNDVVENCYRQGFINNGLAHTGPSNTQGAMIMATTAQPPAAPPVAAPAVPSTSSLYVVADQYDETQDDIDDEGQEISQPNIQGSIFGGFDAPAATDIAQPMVDADNTVPALDMDMINQSFGEFPYDTAFDPNATDNYFFNPFERYEFDVIDTEDIETFNVNDWLHEELFK